MPTRPLLPLAWTVPEVFRQRLGSSAGRQRVMEAEGHLLLVLHCVPVAGERQRRGRFLWRDNVGVWHSSDTGGGVAAVMKHLDEYDAALEQLERMEDEAQQADQYLALLDSLAPFVRSTRNQHNVFQEARTLIPNDRHLIDFRDRAYEIDRNAELLYSDAKNAMDVAVIRRAEEQSRATNQMNRASHRLNLLAAFFFPLATVSSIFGSGLEHGWERASAPLPFLLMIILGLVSGAIIARTVATDKHV